MKSNILSTSIFVFFSSIFFSCVHSGQLESQKIQSSRRIRSLESDLRKKEIAINNLKEQNWILKQKYMVDAKAAPQRVPVPFQPSAGLTQQEDASKAVMIPSNLPQINSPGMNAPTSTATPSGAISNQFSSGAGATVPANALANTIASSKPEEAIATDSKESAEHNLYAKVIANYRQKKSSDLKRVTEILLKSYPQSVFADRAIFLNARLDFENANDQAAMAECERIIRNYPNANKLVSTYFLKAQILKKQGRIVEARSVLSDVQNYFPGSPEAYRVPLELKLLALQSKAAM